MLSSNFDQSIRRTILSFLQYGSKIHTEKWQGVGVKDESAAEMREMVFHDIKVPFPRTDWTNLDYYKAQIKPNLPWADEHFEERVKGLPLNPGQTWMSWPWANSADASRRFKGSFSHTYMERYWPKERLDGTKLEGIRFGYGDLNDVVDLLWDQPNTRQAYLPIFFPEDTGAAHGDRLPCTLGYFWIRRSDVLHVNYMIRSCDVYRHFRDDIYLTVRLTLWLLEQLSKKDPEGWEHVRPGLFSMWVGSLHCFINDFRILQQVHGERPLGDRDENRQRHLLHGSR